MNGMPMDGCRDPAACGFVPTPCTGCVVGQSRAGCPDATLCTACTDQQQCPPHDSPPCWRCTAGQPSADCPDPAACGVIAAVSSSSGAAPSQPAVLNCTGCVPGRSTAGCPNASVCGGVESFPCIGCVGGAVSASCPDPSWCGLSAACFGCVSGSGGSSGGVGCPNLRACVASLPHCSGCVDGLPTAGCPTPEMCGFAPLQCVGCMQGMAMPGCPHPELCSAAAAGSGSDGSDGCVVSMLFQSSSSVCLLLAAWYVSSPAQWMLLVLAVFALAAGREAVIANRQHVLRSRRRERRRQLTALQPAGAQKAQGGSLSSPLLPAQAALPSSSSVLEALYASVQYGAALCLAYLLMLMVMSFNVAVFVIVVLASAAAHLAVNLAFQLLWSRQQQQQQRPAEAAAAVGQPATGGSSALLPADSQQSGEDELKAASDPCCGQVEDWLDD